MTDVDTTPEVLAEPTTEPAPAAEPALDTRTPAEEAKYRRLFEKADKELAAFKAEAAKRAEAEMTEVQKATKRAEEAEARAESLSRERLVSKIAREAGLTDDLAEFLTARDEDGLLTQAQKLAASVKPTVVAGTKTQPASGQAVSIDDQINAAEKSGNAAESIRLKMAKLMS